MRYGIDYYKNFARLRDNISAKLQRLRGNRDVKITLQQSPILSSSNVSNQTYILSTKDENISSNGVVMGFKRSASICSGCVFTQDEPELELIRLENKDEIGAAASVADEDVLPSAKSDHSTSINFESNLK